MKLLNIILCLYMTLLGILPCQDKNDAAFMINTTSIQQAHHHEESAGKETCTPLCTCTCCSTVRTLTPQFTLASAVEVPVNQDYAQPSVPALADQVLSIWQPPQLG